MRTISLLGSTGSIGRQSLDVIAACGMSVAAVAANRSVAQLEDQVRKFQPKLAVCWDESAAADLKTRIADTSTRVASGRTGLLEAATLPEADTVLTAVVGMIGLEPTLAAIHEKKRIALANKETLVCGGELVMSESARCGAEIVPVDSEHSAIFQCLQGSRSHGEIKRVILTASGGPFFGKSREELKYVTRADALKHPNWSMGAKISVDSATMMNKGLEFIEAMHLFGVSPEDIEVLIHPESVVHSAVELVDGTVIAQLGVPDMGLPIQYALTYPERCPSASERLDLTRLAGLSFMRPELDKTPCLALAMDCARRGGNAPAVMSAANEAAVGAFLKGKLGYNEIYESVAWVLGRIGFIAEPSLEEIIASDGEARTLFKERYS